MKNLEIKRIYEGYAPQDGYRILVDRLWPRGISKEKAHLDEWMKEIAPSAALRKWFNHEPDKFNDFARAYAEEFTQDPGKQALLASIEQKMAKGKVTLVYGAKDHEINQAAVLEKIIRTRADRKQE